LFAPESDSYRVLGAREKASTAELRQNMALLLKALHPDIGENKDRAVFAGRVTRAWEDLKTPDRREAYDRERALRIAAAHALPGPKGKTKIDRSKSRRLLPTTHIGEQRHGMIRRDGMIVRQTPTGLIHRALHYFLGSTRK
jgi:curved DNA-binding protein CbpA